MTSNAPSLDQLRHVEAIDAPRVDASSFRQGWRVRTRLDALLADRRISPGDWQAAVEYRDAWGRVLASHRGGEPGAVRSGASDPHRRVLSVLATVTRLRDAEATIGSLAAALCFLAAVEDRSWASTARRYGCDPHTARDWTAEALHGLALAWAGGVPTVRGLSQHPRTPKRRQRAS